MATKIEKITTHMVVTVSGAWLENGKQVTPADVERTVRDTLKDEFWALDGKVTVRRILKEHHDNQD